MSLCFARIECSNFLVTVVSRNHFQKILFSPNQIVKFVSNFDSRIRIEAECSLFKNNIWANLEVIFKFLITSIRNFNNVIIFYLRYLNLKISLN